LEQKYVERFEIWYWRRMEKIKWSEKIDNKKSYSMCKRGECF
jgi:hypothetical protein